MGKVKRLSEMTADDNKFVWVQLKETNPRFADNPLFIREGLKKTASLPPLGFEYREMHVLNRDGELERQLVLIPKEKK